MCIIPMITRGEGNIEREEKKMEGETEKYIYLKRIVEGNEKKEQKRNTYQIQSKST